MYNITYVAVSALHVQTSYCQGIKVFEEFLLVFKLSIIFNETEVLRKTENNA